jgi:hypothetical protein
MKRISLVILFTFSTLSMMAADAKPVAVRALRGDANAVRLLRAMGQPGVDALLAVRATANPVVFNGVIDTVCKQRDCAWSGLYWYTDFEAAKLESRRTAKPILALRLLGNLDEELSCANSRYFRTLLYSNREISAYLKANYVLHWQSVRPAPVITIDLGGGRVMRRTITGNSIHYVANAEGRVLDAIPGLYAPPAFLARIKEGASIHRILRRYPAEQRLTALRSYHFREENTGSRTGAAFSPFHKANDISTTRDRRVAAWMLTPSKSGGGEGVVLEAVSFDARVFGVLAEMAEQLKGIAGTHTIDDNARSLILMKRTATPDPEFRSPKSIETVLENLERTLAADTKINEEKIRPRIRAAIAYGLGNDVDGLNSYVYTNVFMTPDSDPWIGLAAADYFTGITGEGLTVASQQAKR